MLVDLLPAVVAYWDTDGRNVIANPAYREWFGVSPDQMQGRHLREVLGEELYARNLPHIQAALSGHRQSFQRTLADASGALRHAQASYVPDVVDGVVQGFCVLLTDITPEVAAQHALAEAQQLAELGSWQLDLATGQLVWSSQMYRIAGIDPDGAAPTLDAAIELIHPEDRDRVRAVLDTVQESGETYELDYRLIRPDGVVREIRSRGTADLKANGTPVRLSGTWQDVTASNEGARSLAVLNDELQEVEPAQRRRARHARPRHPATVGDPAGIPGRGDRALGPHPGRTAPHLRRARACRRSEDRRDVQRHPCPRQRRRRIDHHRAPACGPARSGPRGSGQ